MSEWSSPSTVASLPAMGSPRRQAPQQTHNHFPFVQQNPSSSAAFQQQQQQWRGMGGSGSLSSAQHSVSVFTSSATYGGAAFPPQAGLPNNNVAQIAPDDGAGCCIPCCPDPRDPCCSCLGGFCDSQMPGQQRPPKFLPPKYCDCTFIGLIVLVAAAVVGFVLVVVLPKGSQSSILAIPKPDSASIAASLVPVGTTAQLEQVFCNQPSYWLDSFRPGYCTQYSLAPTMPTGRNGLECSEIKSSAGLISYFISTDSTTGCAEDYFSASTILLVQSIVQHYLLASCLGLLILGVVGVAMAVYFNDNGCAVELLVRHGVIPPPFDQGAYGLTCDQVCGGCCPCCGDDANQSRGGPNAFGQQQRFPSQATPPTNGASNTVIKQSAATFPILVSNTPQLTWWVTVWRTAGLFHLLTTVWVLYAVLSFTTTWTYYAQGDLGAVLKGIQTKVIAGSVVTVLVSNLPLCWRLLIAPLAWFVCVVPWYCFRVLGDTRVLARPEGYLSAEEREDAIREGFYQITIDSALQQGSTGGQGGVGITQHQLQSTLGSSPRSVPSSPRPTLSAENVERLQQQVGGTTVLHPSMYSALPPVRTFGMGDIATMSRQSALHQHNLLTARLAQGVAASAPIPALRTSIETAVPTPELRMQQVAFTSRDPDALNDEMSLCQRLDAFFIDDCSFCIAFQRQQQEILRATEKRNRGQNIDDATDIVGSVGSKQERRIVGFDSDVPEHALQKALRRKSKDGGSSKDKKSKEKKSKEKKSKERRSKEKKSKKEKDKKSKSSKNNGDDDDSDATPTPRPNTANPLLSRGSIASAAEASPTSNKTPRYRDNSFTGGTEMSQNRSLGGSVEVPVLSSSPVPSFGIALDATTNSLPSGRRGSASPRPNITIEGADEGGAFQQVNSASSLPSLSLTGTTTTRHHHHHQRTPSAVSIASDEAVAESPKKHKKDKKDKLARSSSQSGLSTSRSKSEKPEKKKKEKKEKRVASEDERDNVSD